MLNRVVSILMTNEHHTRCVGFFSLFLFVSSVLASQIRPHNRAFGCALKISSNLDLYF